MPKRQKILLIGLVAALLVGQGISMFSGLFVTPFSERRSNLAALTEQVDEKLDRRLEIRQAQNDYREWKERSLPPDILKAQRLYQEWLTDIAGLAGFTQLKITPVRRSQQGDVFTPLKVNIDGQASYEQVGRFLFHFHRANLAQRVIDLNIDGGKTGGAGPMSVKLTVEGISLREADEREFIFPRTKLEEVIDAKATELTAKTGEGFPESAPFTIRIGQELINVVEQTDDKWKVERGQTSTTASEHAKGDTVEYVDVADSWRTRDLKDYQPILANNLFAKPPADKSAFPVFNKIEKQTLYLGQTFKLTAAIDEAYKPKQQLKYTLEGTKPEGAKLDASKGELTWKPKDDTQPGQVEISLKVIDGSDEKLSDTTKFNIEIKKDDAAKTFLVASFAGAEDTRIAWLHNDENQQRTTLQIGSKIKVADVEGEVKVIDDDFIQMEHDGKKLKLNLGENLRAFETLPDEKKEGEAKEGETKEGTPAEGEAKEGEAKENKPTSDEVKEDKPQDNEANPGESTEDDAQPATAPST